jgi:uncharacterized protein YecT (DUF1311 family)
MTTTMRIASWLTFLSIAILCRAMQANADPAELDDWCAQASQPSSIALCSDPELRELAIERNHAFEAARARLSGDAYRALLREHKGWVRSYSTACGISETTAPQLPLPAETLSCLKRAGQARVEYLWKYVGGNSLLAQPKPTEAPDKAYQEAISNFARALAGSGYVAQPAPTRHRDAACADADLGCKSIRLRQSMTEQEVMAAIGYRPNKVEMQTCGSHTDHPWSCKIFTFGSLYENITVYFSEGTSDNWMVNSWSVYP